MPSGHSLDASTANALKCHNRDVDRHLTVTGFVVHEGLVALHWHQKLAMWLPAGGHIEANEDPVQAVLREIN